MKLNILFLFLSAVILFSNCKNNKQASDKPDTTKNADTLKDISELSYIEIYRILFTNNNGGFDAHGDLYGQDAVSSISFSEEKNACGATIFLSNNSSKDSIKLAVKASFNFPGNPTKEMIRAYTIKPAGKISIGTSKLCYNSKEYLIQRKIISAGFSVN